MAGYLEPVVAEFIAQAERYINPVKDMIDVTAEAEKAADLLRGAAEDLSGALRDSGLAAGEATRAQAALNAVASALKETVGNANDVISSMTRRMTYQAGNAKFLTEALKGLDEELDRKAAAFTAAAGGAALLSRAMNLVTAAAAADTVAQRGGGGARWFGLTANAIHWLVMGTLELASTAVPAMVAFGAAAAGMYPTFSAIADRMNALVVSSGGLRGALLNSVGPLHQLGVSFGTLSAKMAPDAYVIFGSVINDLTGHMGAFSGVARQAGAVLASFATKITQDLNGPAGRMLAGFFANAVKYMVQWGQVLGNIGHTFLNAMSAMFGVGQIVLDVLVGISRALLAISSTRAGAILIGLAAAMSAVYRYSMLVRTVFNWLGGSALVGWFRSLAAAVNEAAASAAAAGDSFGFFRGAAVALDAALPAIGMAVALAAGAFLIYKAATSGASKASQDLISKVESATPTMANLTAGMYRLAAAATRQREALAATVNGWRTSVPLYHSAIGPLRDIGHALGVATEWGHRLSHAFSINAQISSIHAEQAAIRHLALEWVNLAVGMGEAGMRTGQAGAGMAAMAIQTALADSKVQQLNQAIDQYIALLTGGTSGLAAFSQSMANIGQVAGTTANNLATATGSMNLSVGQFARALTSFQGRGAGAWTNFNQVVGSTMPQLLDWFRQASVLGAATGTDVTRAALDMARALVPFAAKSRIAQAELLGVLRSAGLNIRSFGQLEHMVHRNGIGMKDLAKRVGSATIAMSHLSQMAKNVATALSQQVSAQLAQAALNTTNYHRDMLGLQKAWSDNAPPSVIHGWLVKIAGDVQLAGQRGTTMGNQISAASKHAAASTATSAQNMARSFDLAKLHAEAFQNYVNHMHGRTIYINLVTQGTSSLPPGVTGGSSPPPGTNPRAGPQPGFVPGVAHYTSVTVHVHGSVATEQGIVRAIQSGLNRKTIRNGSTQLYIPGRLH